MRAAVAFAFVTGLAGCADGPDPARCYDVCGPGTRCEQGRCVAVEAAPEPAVEEVASKRGRKGKRRAGAGEDGEAPAEQGGSYVPVDDARIPRHDATATRTLDPNAGSERLDDAIVRSHLRKLEPAFDRCIADAAAAGVTVPSGRVEFDFGVQATGKVSGVTARAPAGIQSTGVVSCLRKVVFDHRFPAFDGPMMDVEYAFEIG